MISTVVGSFPAEIKSPTTAKDKILKLFGSYDPFKESIKQTVISQLDAGVDIISDGQVRGDMVSTFTNFIPGMMLEGNNTVITSKIRQPTKEISINDLKYAKKVMNDYFNGNIPKGKGIKGIITGPSTIVYSSRIESFYKHKEDAILDLARSLKYEVEAIEKKINPVYIQVDEPFLSTGLVDLKVASEAIDIIGEIRSAIFGGHGEEELVVLGGRPIEVFGDGIGWNWILEATAVCIAFNHDFNEGTVDHIHLFFAIAIGERHLFATDDGGKILQIIGDGPVQGDVGKGGLSSPAARSVHAINEGLDALLHFLIG